MKLKPRPRQKRYLERLRTQGLKSFQRWVTPQECVALEEALRQIRGVSVAPTAPAAEVEVVPPKPKPARAAKPLKNEGQLELL